MRIHINVRIYGSDSWEPLASQDVEIKVTEEAAAIMPRETVCANLVQSAMAEAMAKAQAQEEANGDG